MICQVAKYFDFKILNKNMDTVTCNAVTVKSKYYTCFELLKYIFQKHELYKNIFKINFLAVIGMYQNIKFTL